MKAWGFCSALLPLLCSAPASSATLTGRVIDSDGQPVAGAKVWLYRHQLSPPYGLLPVAESATAQDGSFSLEGADFDESRIRGRWNLYACAPGLALGAADNPTASKRIEIKLQKPSPLVGRIVDQNGRPIGGALISPALLWFPWGVTGRRSFQLSPEVSQPLVARTDEEGVFALMAAPREVTAELAISAEGYGRRVVEWSAMPRTLRLLRAGKLTGRVICPESAEAVEGLTLYASSPREGDGFLVKETAATDTEGTFSLPELPPGSYELSVPEQSGREYQVREKRNIEVRPGAEAGVRLMAERARVVRGRVIGADTGQGLGGATLYLRQQDFSTEGETGADGRFEILCLPGETSISVEEVEGYTGSWNQQIKVTVGAEGATVADIKLDPQRLLRFIVVDEADNPVPGAVVVYEEPEARFAERWPVGRTGPDGALERKMWSTSTLIIHAEKGGLASEPLSVRAEEQEGPIRLVLKTRRGVAWAITARIVDQNREPVLDARVGGWVIAGPGPFVAQHCDPPDREGRIWLHGTASGAQCSLAIAAPGCDRATTPHWVAEPGVVHDFGTIPLTRHAGVLSGTVVDESGQPISRAIVFNAGDGPEPAATLADEQGHFRLDGLVEGELYVFVDSPHHAFPDVRAQTGTPDLRIVLQSRQPATMGPPQPRNRAMSPDQARELARALLTEAVHQTRGSKAYHRQRLLGELAKLDPAAAIEEATAGGDAMDSIHLAVGLANLAKEFEDAIALIRQADDPGTAARELCGAAREFLDKNPELSRKCAEEALAMTSATGNTPWGIAQSVEVGALIAQFDEGRGAAILEKARAQAAGLGLTGSDAYVRGQVAAKVCEQDLNGALELIAPIEDPNDRERPMVNIVRRVAKTDPGRALELAGQITSDFYRQIALATAVPCFPKERFDQAEEIARGIGGDFHRGLALVRLASVAPTDEVSALIEEAADALAEAAHGPSFSDDAQLGLACLACIARRLGYQQYEQLALRAASLRTRGSGYQIAQALAFTSPELARHVIHSELDLAGGLEKLSARYWHSFPAGVAEVDPSWAAELARQMPPDDPDAQFLPRAEAVLVAVSTLLQSPEEREQKFLGEDARWPWLPVEKDW